MADDLLALWCPFCGKTGTISPQPSPHAEDYFTCDSCGAWDTEPDNIEYGSDSGGFVDRYSGQVLSKRHA